MAVDFEEISEDADLADVKERRDPARFGGLS